MEDGKSPWPPVLCGLTLSRLRHVLVLRFFEPIWQPLGKNRIRGQNADAVYLSFSPKVARSDKMSLWKIEDRGSVHEHRLGRCLESDFFFFLDLFIIWILKYSSENFILIRCVAIISGKVNKNI